MRLNLARSARAAQKKKEHGARKEKRKRVKEILLKNEAENLPHMTNISGWRLKDGEPERIKPC